jgi:hypothetical protein
MDGIFSLPMGMSDAPDNLVPVYLARIERRLGRIEADMREVEERLGILETQKAGWSLSTPACRAGRIPWMGAWPGSSGGSILPAG